MSDYYPEFYLRKRQREQAYRRMTVVVVGFLILLAVFGVVGYIAFNAIATRRTPPGASPQLAEQQQQLQTAEQLASSSVPNDVLQNTQQQPAVDLKSVSYSESFPQVDVKLEGAEAKPEGDATAAETPAEADPNAPAAGREPEATASPAPDTAADETGDTTSKAEAPKPSEQDTRVGSVTPSSNADDDAKRKADQLKRQEQAKREAEKREAAKRAEEKKKRELAKKKQAEDEKAAAAKSNEKKDDSVRAPATKSGGYSYTVYGGTYLSSEDAEKDRAKLGAIGLSGTVIHTAGDYLLLVGRLDDQDSAAALSNKLHGSGFGGAFVTRKSK